MIIVKTISALHIALGFVKQQYKTIGFVPTMGALHNGHLSLIEECNAQTDVTVCSIFINPTQFNDVNDFKNYPVTIENDILLLEKHKTDILFLPAVNEIYPYAQQQKMHYELGDLENILEGKYRPGHYQGVCQVVHRLLKIVQPQVLFLGQKDYQQCIVLQKMITQLSLPVTLQMVETVREENGLAMSSRNLRLTKEQKQQASAIFRALNFIKSNLHKQSIKYIIVAAANILLQAGFEKVDYVEIAEAATLQSLNSIDKPTNAIALIAATIKGVRLIDNENL